MTMKQANPAHRPLLAELMGEKQSRVPQWFMRQAGRYLPEYQRLRAQQTDFLKFCYTPELATTATLQPLDRFELDAAILFCDILVVPDALGCDVRFVEGQGPVVKPVNSLHDIQALTLDHLDEHLSPVYQTVRQVRQALRPETTLIGFAGSPWTLAVYLLDGRGDSGCERTRAFAYEDINAFSALIDILCQAIVRHLLNQIRAGADVVQLFDSWAVWPAESQFRRWIIEPTTYIVAGIREHYPHIPIIGFPRGAGVLYHAYSIETGVNAVSLDASVPLDWAKQILQAHCVIQGNLDNILLMKGGEALETETVRILTSLSDGGFVFNLGHGILPATPPDHLARTVERVRAWQRS